VKGLGKAALGKAWRFLMLVLVTLAAAGPAVGAEMNDSAAMSGRHLMAVKKELEAAGVKPAMDPAKVGATVLSEDDFASGKFLA
jgi:hypothetical protein